MASPNAKVVLVTGANSDIGYETVKALLESDKPHHVILCSRDVEKGNIAMEQLLKECPNVTNTVELLQLDVTSDESIEKAYENVKSSPGRLDVLVNNAGATFDLMLVGGTISLRDCFNKAYDANVTGAHVMSYTFIPLLLKSTDPRLIFVAGLSQITQAAEKYFPTPDLPAGWPKEISFETIGYRCSKNALNMLMLDWNHKLKADGVKVWGVAPGFLRTNLGGGSTTLKDMPELQSAGHPREGGAVLKSVVEGERDADVGKIVAKSGILPW
ncbi:hypothetical protein AJ80_04851 [Polytolypa hystricis UAMH7299]|uniref:Short chain dehydrogenase n=1 Tax=Polytolypa hystricis (strain UAMH7299) TaxID=1447883 RepID=A0A2B7Y836_POLH7|nr:hypothetical protein AJ80_04851 [Polytolypa hystricis UAMH7299]